MSYDPLVTKELLSKISNTSLPLTLALAKQLKTADQQLTRDAEGDQQIWNAVQSMCPWNESDDMDWCDEIMCGLAGVKEELDTLRGLYRAIMGAKLDEASVTGAKEVVKWREKAAGYFYLYAMLSGREFIDAAAQLPDLPADDISTICDIIEK